MSAKHVLLVAAAVLAVAGSGFAVANSALGGQAAEPVNAATISVRHSHFFPGEVTVRVGESVTFTLENDDPIEHEWMVGDEAMHERHRHGTEAVHDSRRDEVTLPPYSTRVTTLTFGTPGDFAYICHLPGHEEYGMRGVVHVLRKSEE